MRLSNEAERILLRRGQFRGRNISNTISRLNLPGERDAVRREDLVVLDSLRSTIAEWFGATIAERSTREFCASSDRERPPINRRTVEAGFRHAQSLDGAVRSRPEVRAFLPGGDRFRKLSHEFDLTSREAFRKYERKFIDSLAGEESRAGPDRIAELASVAARDSVELTVRRATEFSMGYQALTDVFNSNPEKYIGFGCYAAKGLRADQEYASFAKLDAGGAIIARSKDAPVASHKDKVHLNINKEDVPEAWEALRPLLFSPDNPFLSWKMVVLDNAEWLERLNLDCIDEQERSGEPGMDPRKLRDFVYSNTQRSTEGMQFTLYAYAAVGDPGYSRSAASYRHFLTLLDRSLTDIGVRPGRPPDSDVEIEHLSFASYRNENLGSRGAALGEAPLTPEVLDNLRKTPFFLAMQP